MKRIILPTLILLTAAVCAQAMEQQPIDAITELTATIIACDATTFATHWKAFQETATADELTATRSQLTQLATQLKTHKEDTRKQKLLGATKRRVLAGICATISAALGLTGLAGCIENIKKDLSGHKLITKKKLMKRCGFISFSLLFMRLGVLEIDYAYFAGTQELSSEITALDTIIACLAPVTTIAQ